MNLFIYFFCESNYVNDKNEIEMIFLICNWNFSSYYAPASKWSRKGISFLSIKEAQETLHGAYVVAAWFLLAKPYAEVLVNHPIRVGLEDLYMGFNQISKQFKEGLFVYIATERQNLSPRI